MADHPHSDNGAIPKERSGLHILSGRNFSGRTDFLKRITGVEPPDNRLSRCAVYLGPEPETALSGITLSVSQEMRLHKVDGPDVLPEQLWRLTMLEPLYGRVPHTLSGGEMAKLVLACALLLQPRTLCVDGTLEQVDGATRCGLMHTLGSLLEKRILVSDNRIADLGLSADLEPPQRPAKQVADSMDSGNYPVAAARPVRIDLDSIAYRYKSDLPLVLKNVSVALEPGKVHYLEGTNGAGKSTLAKILCGVMRPQHGVIAANHKTYRPWSDGNELISYSFQNPDRGRLRATLRAELTASVRYLAPAISPTDSYRCLQVAAALGLSRLLDHPVDLLPYTVRKRVALAAALAPRVPWLFMDEPTLGQDDATVSAIAQILAAEAESGRGIVVVSHAGVLRSRLPGRRLLLREGQLQTPPGTS